MKRAVLQFTACVLAAGMTVSGTGIAAFAAKDDALAGFGSTAIQSISGNEVGDAQESETQTEESVIGEVQDGAEEATEAAQETAAEEPTEAVQETAVEETTEAAQETAAEESTEAAQETAAEEPTEAAQETTEAVPAEDVTESTQQTDVLDTSMSGEQAFAQCEEYINVRKEASADSEVVGKVYNNGSVTILGAIDGWYKVQSGNATGYVNAEYFATGAAADAFAQEVAYKVATVYSDALTIRSLPSEDSEAIGTVYSSDQLEVVAYEGDWMKVALGNDVYGYVNAYYVGYDTYYATAETLDEEQARLDQQWTDYLAQQQAEEDRQNQEWQAYLDEQAAQSSAEEAFYQTQSYEAPQAEAAVYDESSDAQAEAAAYDYSSDTQAEAAAYDYSSDTQAEAAAYDSGSDAQAQADAAYQNYLDAQAAADEATTQADEQQVYDTAAAAQEAYQAYVNAQAEADEAAAGGYTDESTYQETEAAQYYDETPQTEAPASDYSYTEDSGNTEDYSNTGDAQSQADAAYQAYLEAQAAADAATSQADEQAVYDTAAAAQEAYQAYVNAQTAADEAAAGGYTEETAQTEAPQYEETYVETEAPQYEETEAPTYEETEAPQYEETEAPQTEAPASSAGMAIVNFATQFVGNPYVWGGTSLTNGADCSGFTQSVFANFGISIPRTAAAQASSGTPVDLSEIQAGDLLFYYGDSGIGHVTIYMGNGQVVHASNASTGITISDYGYRTPCSARRYW